MNRNIVMQVDLATGNKIKTIAYFNNRKEATKYVELANKYNKGSYALYDEKGNYLNGYTNSEEDMTKAIEKEIARQMKKNKREDTELRRKYIDGRCERHRNPKYWEKIK